MRATCLPGLARLLLKLQNRGGLVNEAVTSCCEAFNNVYQTVHCKMYTVYCTVYTVNCTLYTMYRKLYTVHYTLYTIHCVLFTVHCSRYTVHCTLYAVLCKMNIVQWIVYSLECTIISQCVRIGAPLPKVEDKKVETKEEKKNIAMCFVSTVTHHHSPVINAKSHSHKPYPC